jgi:hypothetical protein
LTARLKDLEGKGILRRTTLPPPAGSKVYELTDLGRSLEPVVIALSRWGLKLLDAPRPEEETRPAWAMVALQSSLELEAVPGRKETYEFRVDGELFHVQLEGDEAEVRQGPAADPDLIISGDTEILLSVAAGRLTLAEAVEAGAIVTEGDRGSLARCLAMLRSPDGDRGKSVRDDIRAQQAR